MTNVPYRVVHQVGHGDLAERPAPGLLALLRPGSCAGRNVRGPRLRAHGIEAEEREAFGAERPLEGLVMLIGPRAERGV